MTQQVTIFDASDAAKPLFYYLARCGLARVVDKPLVQVS